MGILSSILAWRIAWTQKPGRLQRIGLQSQTRLTLTSCVYGLSHQEGEGQLKGKGTKALRISPTGNVARFNKNEMKQKAGSPVKCKFQINNEELFSISISHRNIWM